MFTDAQRHCRAGELALAVASFERVLAVEHKDGAAALLLERCSQLTTSPPPEWSGTYALVSK